jgi:hypothetical protein
MAAFQLYIPHLGKHIPEKMVYAVLRNMGLGFLSKQRRDHTTGELSGAKAVTLIPRAGRNGKPDFQSAIISFDRLFTRGEDNAGNQAILDHLQGGVELNSGTPKARFVGNDIQIVYQEAGANPREPDAPARYWKAYLYRPEHQRELAASAKSDTSAKPKRPRLVFGTAKAGTGGSKVKAVKFSGGPVLTRSNSADGDAPKSPAYSPESPSYEPTSPSPEGGVATDEAAEAASAACGVHLVRSDSGELRAL